MRRLLLLVLLSLAGLWSVAAATPPPPPERARVPVLLELFTSEGCSSCPPADRVLARLAKDQPIPGVEVLALSEHVDYWNRLGWSDPYSAALFSERQEAYAPNISGGRVYTPQAVVDGLLNLVGGDETGLRRAMAAVADRPHGKLLLTLREPAQPAAGAAISLAVEASALPGDGELLVAVVEDDLISQVTAGENEGRVLPHAAVVRTLQRLGRTSNGAAREQVTLPLDKSWRRGALRVVAFVQERGQPVLASGGLSLGAVAK